VTSITPLDHARRRHPTSQTLSTARFAHPSEALFATLLDRYGHEWLYEPYEFPLAWNAEGQPVRGFRPDFYLPTLGLFIELTVLEQRLVTKKNQKIRQFRTLYPELHLVVVYQRDYAELLERHHLGTLQDLAA